jgi:transcriptional regulator with XRE-family HTH domain
MIGRQKRLHEVYEHLRKYQDIHTQTDLAESLGYSRVYISSAMNGNEKNLTDKLFRNICEAFPNMFNIDYLLNGNGSLLISVNEKEQDKSVNIIDVYAKLISDIADIKHELLMELDAVRSERQVLINTIKNLNDEIRRYKMSDNPAMAAERIDLK